MIVLGIDPGGRWTGFAVIDTAHNHAGPHGGPLIATPDLVASSTVERDPEGTMTQVPRGYLLDVVATARELVQLYSVDLVSVERVTPPNWHHRGKAKPVRPDAIIATGVVFGAVFGREYGVPIVAVPNVANGRSLPLDRYPTPIATAGKGNDKRRHERSAYDVALRGPHAVRIATIGGYA